MEYGHSNRFEQVARYILYILGAMLPLWVLPLPVAVEFGREITFGALILIAGICWFLSILTTGEIHFRRSPILLFLTLFIVVLGISTFASSSPL